jgi:hypothetical protein
MNGIQVPICFRLTTTPATSCGTVNEFRACQTDPARLKKLNELFHLPDKPARGQPQPKLRNYFTCRASRRSVGDYPDPCHLAWHGEEVQWLRRSRVTAETPATLCGTVNEFRACQTTEAARPVTLAL